MDVEGVGIGVSGGAADALASDPLATVEANRRAPPARGPRAAAGSGGTSLRDVPEPITYADAGVDVEAGDKAVELMKASVRRATRPEVLGGLGASQVCSTPARWPG